ncbi:hypothetical protein EDD86DRAFT_245380 [Gorgonomyces haynaldii]|nr:hypothetical protein EDD86DRAFT_245380 [Gorgonomyces haynaldii]
MMFALVAAQTSDCPTYDRCKLDVYNTWILFYKQQFIASGNNTLAAQAQCYYEVELGKCYIHCPNNATVQAEAVAQQQNITTDCQLASLDPKSMPLAPWWVPKPTTSVTVTSSAAPVVQITPQETAVPKTSGAHSNCYYQVEVGKCYIQCPTDPTIVAEGNAQKPAITAACSPVNLNPNALPLAPWVTLSTTVAPTATSKPATASSTASATAKSNSALSAGVENSFLAMLLALVV